MHQFPRGNGPVVFIREVVDLCNSLHITVNAYATSLLLAAGAPGPQDVLSGSRIRARADTARLPRIRVRYLGESADVLIRST